MSQTIDTLIKDVIPRLTNAPKGISIYQAANSILSLVYKKLLDRDSDLLASGELDLIIPPFGYSAVLPTDFVAMAEKPRAEDIYNDWMAGNVTSYDSVSGTLVFNSTSSEGQDQLNDWQIALSETPGNPSEVIGYSSTTLVPTTGSVTLVMTAGLTLPVSTYIFVIPGTASLKPRIKQLQPLYLNEDEEHDREWWSWYGYYGYSWEPPVNRPSKYKIIGTTFHIRPHVIIGTVIKGRYFQKPVDFANPTDVIPWGLFYEVFREGVVRIILKGISIPEADTDFMAFIHREIDTIIMARFRTLPKRRTDRSTWL